MAGFDASRLKEFSAASAMAVAEAEEKGAMSSGHELPVAAEEEVNIVENPVPAAAAEKKMWRMPQEEIDFILSWDVPGDVSPNLDRIERLPISEELKVVFRVTQLQFVAGKNQQRRMEREKQQWVRDEFEKHGYVLVDEDNLIDVKRAREHGYVPVDEDNLQ